MGGVIVGVVVVFLLFGRTPHPAAEPAPIPVPTFTPTPGVMQGNYSQLATQYQQALADAMTQVGQLLAAPQLDDADWKAQVAEAIVDVDNAYTSLLRLEPPEAWRPFHQEMITGAADCSAAMRVLDLALDEQDRNAVPVVAALLNRCQSHINAASKLVIE